MSLKQRVPLLRWSFWRIAAGSRNITTTGQIGDVLATMISDLVLKSDYLGG